MAPPASMLDCALDALAHGLAVIPPAEDGSKRPDVKQWKNFQKRPPTGDEVRSWYEAGRSGLGILTGAVSGNLEMLEFEGRAVDDNLLEEFQALADAAGLGELVARIITGYAESTPSGGIHLLYRLSDGTVAGNTKLARRLGPDPETIDVLIETRGEGGYVVVAPSHGTVHPSGSEWALLHGGFATIATITAQERDELHRIGRALDRMPKAPAREQVPTPGRSMFDGPKPGESYNADPQAAQRTLQLLEHHGWVAVFERGHDVHLRRPGKEHGTSAVLHMDGGVLMVFTTSTIFEAEEAYTPFGVLATLEHGGDYSAAARALRPERDRPAPSNGSQPYDDAPPPYDEAPPPEDDAPAGTSAIDRIRGAILHGSEIKNIPARRSLVKGMLDLNSLAVLYGRPGSGKSFLAVDISLHIATASWWHGHKVRGGDVLYVVAEGTGGIAARQTAWEQQNNRYSAIDTMHWLPLAVNLLDPVASGALAVVAEELQPSLVVIDTLARSMAGGDENTGKDMGRVIEAADHIKTRTGACVLIVHHSGKDQTAGARGWSGLFGAVDTELELKSAENVMLLSTTKQKDNAAEPLPLRFTLVPQTWQCPDCGGSGLVDGEECDRCDGDQEIGSVAVARYTGQISPDSGLSGKVQTTLDALASIDTGSGVPGGQWQEVALEQGVPKPSFFRHRKMLIERGLVAEKSKRYRIVLAVEDVA